MGRLDGRIAFVTGGARGIGRAIAEKFVVEGATVAFADVDEAAGRQTARELTAAGLPVTFCGADITVEAEVQRAIHAVVDRHGTLDVLVNNAGVNAYYDATAMTEAEWNRVFDVDLKGAWLCAKHALQPMKRAGRGSIVNIASIHASLTIPGMFPYAAAKAGLVGLTRSLALEYGPAGIRVNAVLPGYTRTRLVEEWLATQPDPAEMEQRVIAIQPLRRMAAPADIANVPAGWRIAGIPLDWTSPVLMIGLAAVFQILMTRFQWGRAIFAIGGNAVAARFSGVSVGLVQSSVYLVSAGLAGVSGVALTIVQGQGKADLAMGYELDIIASAVVGGASLSGGRGSVVGAVLGTLIFGVLRNALPQIPGATFYDRLILGIVVIAIVVMDQLLQRRKGASA